MKEATMNGPEAQTLALAPAAALMRRWDTPTTGEWARVLATFPLFSGLSKRGLRKLVRHATLVEFVPGEAVIHRNAPTDSLYVILSGIAEVRGRPAARTLRAGDYFGELALLDGGPRSATVVATQQLHVMRLPRQSFLRLAQHDPGISLTMLRNLGAQLRRLETQTARR
jgi:CRP/FNR family transcriptional regulator, cyclic AMP receptor protein